MDVATIIEGAAAGRVLVVGSPPPAGRDWDLMLRDPDRAAVQTALESNGFEPVRGAWARFGLSGVELVELLGPTDWGLSATEAQELFAQARGLDGHSHLCTPSPTHRLLILARKLPRTPGLLAPHHRRALEEALAQSPDSFEQARLRAREWGVSRRLNRLESRSRHRPRRRWPPRYLRLPRRGAVVTLSGLDGVGKSTQAQALGASLRTLGYDATVVWAPIGSSLALRRFATAVKLGLTRLPVGPLAHAEPQTAHRRLLADVEGTVESSGHPRKLVAAAWSTVITLANAVSYRRAARGTRTRGRIVIYDRYVLDTIVELRFSYAPHGRLPLQEGLVRRLAPRPLCAFWLDAPAEVAHARKPDWSLAQTRLRARLYRDGSAAVDACWLDAQRPAEDLTAAITREVLHTLDSKRKRRVVARRTAR